MLAFEETEKRNALKRNDEFVASLGEVTTEMLREKLRKLGHQTMVDIAKIADVKALVGELDVMLDKFGIGQYCEAFAVDCDLAKDWRMLFTAWGDENAPSQRERSVNIAKLESSKYC